MIVTRQGHTFDVDDNDLSGDWGFWQRFADGSWEPEILDRMPELLADGGTFLDIGAWIGPTSLWASKFCSNVWAIEPDPTAHEVLLRNIANASVPSSVSHGAVADYTGTTTITTAGDSMSRTGDGDHEVRCWTVTDVIGAALPWYDRISLVKIDIEGAEETVFPHGREALRSLDCPVFLSIHPWCKSDPLADHTGFRVEHIADHEVLLWPV